MPLNFPRASCAEAARRSPCEPVTISVLPGEEGAGEVTSFSEGVQRRDVEALGDDILPAPGDVRLRDHRLAAALPWPHPCICILLKTTYLEMFAILKCLKKIKLLIYRLYNILNLYDTLNKQYFMALH